MLPRRVVFFPSALRRLSSASQRSSMDENPPNAITSAIQGMVIASLTAAMRRFSSMSEESDMACVDCPLP